MNRDRGTVPCAAEAKYGPSMLPIRCAAFSSLHTATKPLVRLSPTFLHRRRTYADQPRPSPIRYQPDPDSDATNVQDQFAGHAMSALRDMRKVLVFLASGVLITGTAAAVVFEAGHFWIESKMRERPDDDALRWGWSAESWSDATTGGTSPELGFIGRHAARAAWFSLRYGHHFTTSTTISQIPGGRPDQGSLNIVDPGLESARIYLEKAIARIRDDQGHPRRDGVGLDLIERHAAVMEHIGTRPALEKAREEYREVLHGRAGQRLTEARLAVKLGDLSERLGYDSDALSWWRRGIELSRDDRLGTSSQPLSSEQSLETLDRSAKTTDMNVSILIPEHPPSIPAAQRTLAAAMLSLSAYYSQRKQLKEAKGIQEAAIHLIDSMVPQPKMSSSTHGSSRSPGHTLHNMYLLHRKALLVLHHGEVTFALNRSKKVSGTLPHKAALADLLTAASSSEIVAQILTGTSLSHPDLPSSHVKSENESLPRIPHPPSANSPLLSVYLESPGLSAPAASVLRDARLAAAEAWDLCGVLYSGVGGKAEDVKAFECFERALGWVGDDPVETGSREGMGAEEWRALWSRFVEAREKILQKPK